MFLSVTDIKYSYQKENFKKSIQIIMKTLILDIDISLSIDETEQLGRKILKILD